MYNIVECITGTQIYDGPFDIDRAYHLRDVLQAESLGEGHILTEYRYALRLVE